MAAPGKDAVQNMKRIKETDYGYASARLRVLENRLIGRERMQVLCEIGSREELLTRLSEYGVVIPPERDGEETALLAILRQAYDEVAACVPDRRVLDWMRYPYDCNNLKMALKCHIRHIPADEMRGMLFDFGTIPADRVPALIECETLPEDMPLPPHMAAALADAREVYAKTGDPRVIDLRLDAACYRDMSRAVAETGESILMGWVRAKIDLTNLITTLRVGRLSLGETAEGFLTEALLPGGTIAAEVFCESLSEGEEHLLWSIGRSGDPLLDRVATRIGKTDMSLSAIEKCCDDAFLEQVRRDARAPFGVAVVGGYLYGWETAVRNIRILLAARDAGLSPAATRERVRESYV